MQRRNWTEEEITFLKDHVGKMKIASIAKRLSRNEAAIICKMKRLGISNTKAQTGYLTTYELGDLLKIDSGTIRNWITKHGLKANIKTTRNTRKFYLIHPEDFWTWANENRDRIDFTKIEHQSIPPEPAWVEKERKNKRNMTKKMWSTQEEKILRMLIEEGFTIPEVAKKLDRTIISIQKKYKRLTSVR